MCKIRNIIWLWFLLTCSCSSLLGQAPSCPPNIDFEDSSFSNWNLKAGKYTAGTITFPSSPVVPVITNYAGIGSFTHRIVGTRSVDPRTGTNLDYYSGLPIKCPKGGNYSVQLGSEVIGSIARVMTYKINIPPGANVFSITYYYSVVFEDPVANHTPDEKPKFTARLLDQDSVPISCASFEYKADPSLIANGTFQKSPRVRPSGNGSGVDVYYKDWTPVTFNLSGRAGQSVILEFTAEDCSRSAHFGYAYVDVISNCGSPLSSEFCQNAPAFDLNGPPGYGTYTWATYNPSNKHLNLPYLSAGAGPGYQNYTVQPPLLANGTNIALEIISASGCKDTLYTRLKQHTLPTGEITPDTNICVGGSADLSINLSGVGPWNITYTQDGGNTIKTVSGISATPYALHVTPGATTTYTITGVRDALCSNSGGNLSSATVTVISYPSVFHVTGGGNICSGGAGIPVGLDNSQTGMRYQLYLGGAPVGPVVTGTGQAISFGAQLTAGNYTVTASNALSPHCAINMNGTVVVTAVTPGAPTATAATYCQNSAVAPLSATPSTGGNLLWYTTSNGGTGSSIAPSPSTAVAGTTNFYVSEILNGCEGPRASIPVIVNGTPGMPSTSGVTYCLNAEAVVLGATGSNLRWYTNAIGGIGDIMAPKPVTSSPGSTSYYVSQTLNGCEGPRAPLVVTVNAPPGLPATTPVQYCQNATALALVAAGSNLLWYASAAGGIGSAVAPTPLTATTGSTSYFVSQTANGCESPRSSLTVTVNAIPDAYSLTGGGNFCQGSTGVPVGISNSDSGTNYQLFIDGAAQGAALPGTSGKPLSFGNQTVPGLYTVVGINAANGTCTTRMSGAVTVTSSPIPAVYSVTGGGGYCSAAGGLPVGLSGSETGVSYQLYHDGSIQGSPVNGTGNPVTFGNQTQAGTYTVVASNLIHPGCSANMNGSAMVTIHQSPVSFAITGGGSYCSGGLGIPVGISKTETGFNYQLYINGSATANLVAGNGDPIDFGNQTQGGTYTVTAINTTVPACTANMEGNVLVIVNPTPATYSIGGGGNFCAGGTGVPVTLSNSALGFTYQLYYNGSPSGIPVSGNGSGISFGNQTQSGAYTVIASNSSLTCARSMAGKAIVTASAIPVPFGVGGGGSFCSSDKGLPVKLSGSETGFNYELYLNGVASGNLVSGTGGEISFGNQLQAGMYTIVGYNPGNPSCQTNMKANAIVKINPVPVVSINNIHPICRGDSISLIASGAGMYDWGNLLQTSQVRLSPSMDSVVSVKGTDGNGCFAIDSKLLTVHKLPIPVISAIHDFQFCEGDKLQLTGSGDPGSGTVSSYQWYLNNNPIGTSALSFYTDTPGNYTLSLINSFGCKQVSPVAQVRVVPLPEGNIIQPDSSNRIICENSFVMLTASGGVSYQWYLNDLPIAGATGSVFNATKEGTYSVVLKNTLCSKLAVNTITLKMLKKPVVDFVYANHCGNLPVSYINQSQTSQSGPIQWKWDLGDGQFLTTKDGFDTYRAAGNYIVSLTALPESCPDLVTTQTKKVRIDLPEKGVVYKPVDVKIHTSVILHARDIGANYLWMPSTGLNGITTKDPVFNYNLPQRYFIRIESSAGCVTVDTLQVNIFSDAYIVVAKAFSPNGDGSNDLLFPFHAGIRQLNYFRVFNRWGQLMFETNQLDKGWDGVAGGRLQPMDTYTWILQAVTDEGAVIQQAGKTVLLR